MGQAKIQRSINLFNSSQLISIAEHIESKIQELRMKQELQEKNRFEEYVKTGFFKQVKSDIEAQTILVQNYDYYYRSKSKYSMQSI